jgi:hypothetical protein
MGLFPLGRTVATRTAIAMLKEVGVTPQSLLERHHRGDWGNSVTPDGWEANERALVEDGRLLSVYVVGDGLKVYVITEADRSAKTVMLAQEY